MTCGLVPLFVDFGHSFLGLWTERVFSGSAFEFWEFASASTWLFLDRCVMDCDYCA